MTTTVKIPTEAYPLQWPTWRPRTPYTKRRRAAFKSINTTSHQRSDGSTYEQTRHSALSVAGSIRRIQREFRRFTRSGQTWRIDPESVVISTNLRARQDNLPYSNAAEPDDPGSAVYFYLDKQPHCLSCDKWDRVADNLAAIAAHVAATRGQERWGVADVREMFQGFKALPGPGTDAITVGYFATVEAAAVFISTQSGLGVVLDDPESIDAAYRAAAKKLHPDAGGSVELFLRLTEARRMLRGLIGAVK